MNYENNKTKIHGFIFILVIILYIYSPDTGLKMGNQNVWGKEVETATGKVQIGVVSQIQVGGKEDSKKAKSVLNETNGHDKGKISEVDSVPVKKGPSDSIRLCDAECKINTLTGIGIRPEIAESLVVNCKAMADDPVNCIKIGAFIVGNESSGGKNCKKSNKYNCSGLSVKENYKSYNDAIIHWVGKYNKFWYNQKTPDSFYSNSPNWNPKTRYCMSERQPDGTKLPYCPNGHRNAWNIYNKLKW